MPSSPLSIYEAEIMTKPEAPLDQVEQELRSLRAGNTTGMFLTIIEESADRTSHTEAPVDRQGHKDILDELNRLCRKLKRSAVTEEKIRTELSNLSEHAKTFVQVELALHQLQRPFDLASEDWSDPSLQIALEKSALDTRRWVRQTPCGTADFGNRDRGAPSQEGRRPAAIPSDQTSIRRHCRQCRTQRQEQGRVHTPAIDVDKRTPTMGKECSAPRKRGQSPESRTFIPPPIRAVQHCDH